MRNRTGKPSRCSMSAAYIWNSSHIQPALVHHPDRGSQYASNDYTDLLKAHQIEISMSRKGNPWDNAASESFMKTLKYEECLPRLIQVRVSSLLRENFPQERALVRYPEPLRDEAATT